MHNSNNQSPVDMTSLWKKEESRKLRGRVIRRSLAVPFLLLWPVLIFSGILSVPAFVLMILGSILIAPDIVQYFSGFADNILWSHREGEPRPNYDIPESLVARGKYSEAEAEYEKIIEEFPGEIKPHTDMINIAVRWLNDGELAEKLYQKGISLLQDPADRDTLTEIYKAIKTRLKSEEERKVTAIPLEKVKEVKERLARNRQKYWR